MSMEIINITNRLTATTLTILLERITRIFVLDFILYLALCDGILYSLIVILLHLDGQKGKIWLYI